jgi:hypothetical protein
MTDTVNRALRTLMQLIAGGGLTALVGMLLDGLSPEAAAFTTVITTFLVTFAQNWLEEHSVIPTVLKPQPSP